jgi:predicted DNA-binding transcriptional regulator YafY
VSLKLDNLITLFEFLGEDRWKSAEAVAQELEVDRRTVMRYMREIERAFDPFPIVESCREGYRLCKNDFLETLQRRDDYAGLAAVMSTPLGSLVRPNRPLPETLEVSVREIVETRSTLSHKQARPLLEAMRTGAYLKLSYRATTTLKEHVCAPIKLSIDSGIPYVACFDEHHGHLICLAAGKIEQISKAGRKLAPPQLAELRSYVNSAWGRMIQHKEGIREEVSFLANPSVARYFTVAALHKSQRVKPQDKGVLITLTVHNLKEFVRYLLRYGQAVRIISPQAAIDELLRFVDSMKSFYVSEEGTELPGA